MPSLVPLRLNLGCDRWKLPGFVNLDRVVIPGEVEPDLQCDVRSLPYEDGSVDEIYAGHIIEHFDVMEVPAVLREWRRVLKPGAAIWFVTPDAERVLSMYRHRMHDLAYVQWILFGARTRAEQDHCQVLTADLLLDEVRPVFPRAIEVPLSACPYLVSQIGWQCCVRATK